MSLQQTVAAFDAQAKKKNIVLHFEICGKSIEKDQDVEGRNSQRFVGHLAVFRDDQQICQASFRECELPLVLSSCLLFVSPQLVILPPHQNPSVFPLVWVNTRWVVCNLTSNMLKFKH